MKGWKTWATIAAMVAYGIVGAVTEMHDWNKCAEILIAAFGLFGIGSKIEKNSNNGNN